MAVSVQEALIGLMFLLFLSDQFGEEKMDLGAIG
jgi:hypothetical protein